MARIELGRGGIVEAKLALRGAVAPQYAAPAC